MPADTLPRSLLKTRAGQAAVAQAWLDGHTQIEIARRVFGYESPTPVNVAMRALVSRYCPEALDACSPSAQFGALAIARYLETRHAR